MTNTKSRKVTDPFLAISSQKVSVEEKASALDSSATAMVIVDANAPDQPIVYCNNAFTRLFGYRRDEVIGQNCRFLNRYEGDRSDVKDVRRIVQSRLGGVSKLTNYTKNGDRLIIELRISPIFDQHGHVSHLLGEQKDVTALEDALVNLKASEEHYRRLIENLPAAVSVRRPDGSIVLKNEQALNGPRLEVTGQGYVWDGGELIEATGAVISPEDLPFGRVLKSRLPETGRIIGIRATGDETVWKVANAYPEFDANGALTQIVTVDIDVTEQVKLASSLRIFRRAFEAAATGILISKITPEGRKIKHVNDAFLSMSGIENSQLTDAATWLVVDPRLNSVTEKAVSEAIQHARIVKRIVQHRGKDGVTHWTNLALAPVIDPDGQITHLVKTYTDISNLVDQRNRLRKSEKQIRAESLRLKTIFDSSLNGIISLDEAFRITLFSRGAESIFGSRASKAVGRLFGEFLSDATNSVFDHIIAGAAVGNSHAKRKIEILADWSSALGRRSNGQTFPMALSLSRTKIGSSDTYTVIVKDLTELAEKEALVEQERLEKELAEKKARDLAALDPMTGLPNTVSLLDCLAGRLASAEIDGSGIGLLYADIDNLTHINEIFGHEVGNKVVTAMAKRITASVAPECFVARLFGDEFVVVIPMESHADRANLEAIADSLLAIIAKPFLIGSQEILVSCSIGISCAGIDAETATELVQAADAAMHEAKKAGRNCYRVYLREIRQISERRVKLTSAMKLDLFEQRFSLNWQPQIDITNHRLIGAEVLARWDRMDGTPISPAEFIPLAEETGFILQLGEWIIWQTCQQMSAWIAKGLNVPPIGINVSAVQVARSNIDETLAKTLHHFNLDPHTIEVEITESTLMENLESSFAKLNQIGRLGINVAIDDFGTGYSSLAYLRQLNVDRLKIDRSFVQHLGTLDSNDAIVRAIVSMANALQIDVIAEGVETEQQRLALLEMGVTQGQGYLWSRPLTADKFATWLKPCSQNA